MTTPATLPCPACTAAGRTAPVEFCETVRFDLKRHNEACADQGERVYRVNGRIITGLRRVALAGAVLLTTTACGRSITAPPMDCWSNPRAVVDTIGWVMRATGDTSGAIRICVTGPVTVGGL